MKYIELFENISPELIANCEQVASADIHFKDPFNDFVGIDPFKRLLFKALKDVKNPKFTVVDQACSHSRHYVRWDFSGCVRGLGDWQFSGMSELSYNAEGLVCEHIDHWDASEYFFEKIPVFGWPISCVKKRLQVS